MARNSMQSIQAFLGLKRIAFVGVSSRPADFSRLLYGDLRQRGYDVVPVNPKLTEVDGEACYPSVTAIQPAVEGALLMTSAAMTDRIVHDCADAGVKYVWMYRALGQGAVNDQAVEFGRSLGMNVVAGECPFMFIKHSEFPHNLHGLVKVITRTYPD